MSIMALIVLGLLTTGVVVLHSSVVDARSRRLAPAVEEARRILAASLSAGSVPSDHDLSRLLSLPRDRLISLVGEVSRSFRGERGEVIRRLARELDIVNRGFRLVASRLWWRRLEGARLLTLFDEARTVRQALLEDPHPLVRAQAAEWAWTSAKPDEIRTLVALLDDPDGLVRYSARDALIRLGPAAARRWPKTSPGRPGPVPVALLEVAGAINDPRLLPGALRLVSDDHPRTRELAARLLGSLGGAEAIDEMADLLDDSDPAVRSAAAPAAWASWATGRSAHGSPPGSRIARGTCGAPPGWRCGRSGPPASCCCGGPPAPRIRSPRTWPGRSSISARSTSRSPRDGCRRRPDSQCERTLQRDRLRVLPRRQRLLSPAHGVGGLAAPIPLLRGGRRVPPPHPLLAGRPSDLDARAGLQRGEPRSSRACARS